MKAMQMSKDAFNVGDRVNVVRTRHGWYDGSLQATVVSRSQRDTGTFSYMVRDLDGAVHEVNHTRDMYKSLGNNR